MEWILESYLRKKYEKPPTLKPPKIDVKKKDYDTIVKLVDAASGQDSEPRPLAITKK